jgi:predicted nucleic acid-binding protein
VTAVLVDSNVLIDVLAPDPDWEAWSSDALRRAADRAVLVINPIVFAEVSFGYTTIEALDDALDREQLKREALPWAAAFLAGRAYLDYRRRGGERRSPLPDFFIGAHAAVAGYGLLTRDPARYRTYFPRLELIAPDGT